MNKPKIKLTIIKEDIGYSAVGKWKNRCLATCGDDRKELEVMIIEMLNFMFEDLDFTYSITEIEFSYDMHSFFDFYKIISNKVLSERIGMNQSLLAQYINGIKKPSAAQRQRIIKGAQQIGRELSEVDIFS